MFCHFSYCFVAVSRCQTERGGVGGVEASPGAREPFLGQTGLSNNDNDNNDDNDDNVNNDNDNHNNDDTNDDDNSDNDNDDDIYT